jgi:hypothetical protein
LFSERNDVKSRAVDERAKNKRNGMAISASQSWPDNLQRNLDISRKIFAKAMSICQRSNHKWQANIPIKRTSPPFTKLQKEYLAVSNRRK